MRVRFTAPAGWIRQAFPPPQRGVYLRAPVAPGAPDTASILLLDAVNASGKLDDQLATFVTDGCRDAEPSGKTAKPTPFKSKAGAGLATAVQVKVARGREETRVFALVDAGPVRLPLSSSADRRRRGPASTACSSRSSPCPPRTSRS